MTELHLLVSFILLLLWLLWFGLLITALNASRLRRRLRRRLDTLIASHDVLQEFVDELHDRLVKIEPQGTEARRLVERSDAVSGSGFPWTPEEFAAMKARDGDLPRSGSQITSAPTPSGYIRAGEKLIARMKENQD